MIHFSHLTTAAQLLQQYKGEQPFDGFIKDFFRQHKKYGSKDRKNINQLCYAYFRIGKALPDASIEEKIKAGLLLCSNEPNELLEFVSPEWNEKAALSIEEKLAITGGQLANVFPWKEELSEGIDYLPFSKSFFIQPDIFLRLRPGKETVVKQKLEKAGIAFKELTTSCLSLPNASKVSEAIELNKEAVIQDYNSQQTGQLLASEVRNLPAGRQGHKSEIRNVWDCCAGSGGKSIMLYDLLQPIELIVSDIRPSILTNLAKRFATAGITNYEGFIADLKRSIPDSSFPAHNLIVADVPCTGSGTWSRTPEQLVFFKESDIDVYSKWQKKITGNIIPHLRKGGYLLYITCSVFKKENEEVVQFIREKFNLHLQRMELLKGYGQRADTLFAALLTA